MKIVTFSIKSNALSLGVLDIMQKKLSLLSIDYYIEHSFNMLCVNWFFAKEL